MKLKRRKDMMWALFFILPSFAGFAVFVIFPVISSFLLGFTKWTLLSGFSGIKFVGLRNFIRLFEDGSFLSSLRNNLIYTAVTVPASIIIGLILAALINDWCYGKNAIKVSLFIPYISSIVAVSIVWMFLLHPSKGPVNQFLRSIGITDPPGWFVDMDWALLSIIMLSVWKDIGYTVLIYIAGLNAINPSLYEAAKIDGATPFQEFFRITIPMVSPTTVFLITITTIGSFRVFDQIRVITEGGPGNATNVLAYYIYETAFTQYRMGYASSIAWVLFIIIFGLTVVTRKLQKSVVYE